MVCPTLIERYIAPEILNVNRASSTATFDKKSGGGMRTRDMHFYDLPWPVEVLQALLITYK